jgi:hypothetical protein
MPMTYDDSLKAIVTNDLNAMTIELTNLNGQQIESIAAALIFNTSVSRLIVKDSSIDSTTREASIISNLAQAVRRQAPAPTLTAITLSNCRRSVWNNWENSYNPTSIAITELLDALKRNASVTELDFSGTQLDTLAPEAFTRLLTTNKTIRSLHLDSTKLNSAAVDAIFNSLSQNHSLQRLSLNHLALGSLFYKPTALITMLATLTRSMEYLSIRGNDYSKNDHVAILGALKKNHCLQELSISIAESSIWDAVEPILCNGETGLRGMHIFCTDFKMMDTSHPISFLARKSSGLTHLQFTSRYWYSSYCPNNQFEALIKEVVNNPTLNTLSFDTVLTHKQGTMLFNALCNHPGLTHLTLTGHYLNDEDCTAAIANFIRSNKAITHLSLKGNYISLTARRKFHALVKNHPTLRVFDLESGDIPNDQRQIEELVNESRKPYDQAHLLYNENKTKQGGLEILLDMVSVFANTHLNLQDLQREVQRAGTTSTITIIAAMKKLEYDLLPILIVSDFPLCGQVVVYLASMLRADISAFEIKNTVGFLTKNKTKIIAELNQMPADHRLPAGNASDRFALVLIAMYSLAIEKETMLTQAPLLSALNGLANTESLVLQTVPLHGLIMLLKRQLPHLSETLSALLNEDITSELDDDSSKRVIEKIMAIKEVRDIMLRDKFMIDGFAALQLAQMLMMTIQNTPLQLIETAFKCLSTYQSLHACLVVSASPAAAIPAAAQVQYVELHNTPFDTHQGNLSPAQAAAQILTTRHLQGIKLHLTHTLTQNGSYNLTLTKANHTAPSSSNQLLSPDAQQAKINREVGDVDQLTDIVRFLTTVNPKLTIEKITIPVINRHEQTASVQFTVSKEMVNTVVALLKSWQFIPNHTAKIAPEVEAAPSISNFQFFKAIAYATIGHDTGLRAIIGNPAAQAGTQSATPDSTAPVTSGAQPVEEDQSMSSATAHIGNLDL